MTFDQPSGLQLRGDSGIRAAFFDLDDTLCDDASTWVRCACLSAQTAAAIDPTVDVQSLALAFLDVSRRYWAGPECMAETRPLSDVRGDQWLQALNMVSRGGDEDLAHSLAEEYGRLRITEIAVFPDAVSTLEALRARGLKLALITNGFRSTHVEKIARLGLDRHFDHVLIAEIVGHFKPDERIFRHALELCSCSPHEAIMVGDDLANDIGGAEAMGIRAYWFNPHGRPLPQSAQRPSGGSISALAELLGLFS